jgi:myo-inositol-1(or 4)-monophosphatase
MKRTAIATANRLLRFRERKNRSVSHSGQASGTKGDRKMNGVASIMYVSELEEIERVAVELATLAGAEIQAALGNMIAVRYKGEAPEKTLWRDPVSEIDHRIETLIRARLAERFPRHDIIGEEMTDRPGLNDDCVWAVDPIDGTANFVNGFPMFAASIGVLQRGRPVVGAVWCSTGHALRPGVYHASAGCKLRFEDSDVTPKINPAVRRQLAGVPVVTPNDRNWETRKTGSAAIECALVAAGMLRVARFESANIWDGAAGIALVEAAGGIVRQQRDGRWESMRGFSPEQSAIGGEADLRFWRHPVIVGAPEAVERMCAVA